MSTKKQKFYVVVQYILRPRNKMKTYDPEYMSEPRNYQYDELFNIVTKVKDNELTRYSIILDLTNKKVVKNSSSNNKSYQEILQYFINNYSERFTQMLGEYITEVKDLMPVVNPEHVHVEKTEEPVPAGAV